MLTVLRKFISVRKPREHGLIMLAEFQICQETRKHALSLLVVFGDFIYISGSARNMT
jgi:hypothetical protein